MFGKVQEFKIFGKSQKGNFGEKVIDIFKRFDPRCTEKIKIVDEEHQQCTSLHTRK